MVAEREETQKSYQRALRIIGRYLDAEPSYELHIAETEDGFTVRAHAGGGHGDEHVKHFEWDRLATEDQFYGAAGRGAGSPRRRAQETWAFPCRHEQALRKLGSILDEEQVASLTVQETQDGLVVTYSDGGNSEGRQQRTFGPDELCSSTESA